MPERSFDSVIRCNCRGTLKGLVRQDTELTETRQFGYQVYVKGFANNIQPVGLSEVFEGKNGEDNLITVSTVLQVFEIL